MKFYLSSSKLGDRKEELKRMLPKNPKCLYISNALDFAIPEKRKKHQDFDIEELKNLSMKVEPLDLKKYFNKQKNLRKKVEEADIIYVSGGNVFDLRLAMQLSGFDEILKELQKTDKIYAAYSAGVCVLSPTLEGYDIVDDPDHKKYGNYKTNYSGLGIIDWQFAPHYKSEHHESENVDKEIEFHKKNNRPYKALHDGEVIIIE